MAVRLSKKHFAGGRHLYNADADGLAFILQSLAVQQARVALSGVAAMTDSSGGATADNFVNPIPLPVASVQAPAAAYSTVLFIGQPVPLTPATGQVVFTGLPANNDTVTVNGTAYTFQTVLTNVANNVLIGATPAACAFNLAAALNATASGSGTLFAAATVANTTVSGSTVNVDPSQALGGSYVHENPADRNLNFAGNTPVTQLTAITGGTGGNAFTLAKSCANAQISGDTFSGGAAADTLTINGATALTFVTTATTGFNVQIGANLSATMANLVAAILTNTVALGVTGSASNQIEVAPTNFATEPVYYESATLLLVANTAGDAGNTITVAKTSGGNLAVSGSTLLHGVAPVQGQAASGTLTMAGQPAANDTVTINGATAITFVAGAPAANQVQIGATLAVTLNNLVNLIEAAPATYAVAASTSPTVVTLTALTIGTAGNAITLAKSCANMTLSAANLAGGVVGVNGVFANGTVTFVSQPDANSDTVTLNGTAISFVLPGLATFGNQVPIAFGGAAATAANFAAFVNANSSVFLMNASAAGNVVNLTANLVGTGGNSVTIAKSSNDITLSGATLANGGPSGAVDKASVETALASVVAALGETAFKLVALQTKVPTMALVNNIGGTGSGTVAAITKTVQQADGDFVGAVGFIATANVVRNAIATQVGVVNKMAFAVGIAPLDNQSGGTPSYGDAQTMGPISTSTGAVGLGVAADTVLSNSASQFFTGVANAIEEIVFKINQIVSTNAILTSQVVAKAA